VEASEEEEEEVKQQLEASAVLAEAQVIELDSVDTTMSSKKMENLTSSSCISEIGSGYDDEPKSDDTEVFDADRVSPSSGGSEAEDKENEAPPVRFSEMKEEQRHPAVAAKANLPSMFSSSFSSLKSFARRSMSADLEKGEAANEDGESQSKVEKRNLLGMAKLSIKGLIESSLSAGHTLDSDHEPLQQFFVIIEYIMRQGLKAPKNFFIQNKYFWPVVEGVEKFSSEATVIGDSSRNLPGVRTHLGRGRAWLRLAVMQKKLAHYLKIIVENREFFCEWYEADALLMCDEGTVLIGHLVGLNCIDANLCMKGEDLDNQVTVIDYSQYMKTGRSSLPPNPDEVELEKLITEKMEGNVVQKLTDQKNYLEERNRYLETARTELTERSDKLEVANIELEAELKAAKIQLSTLQNDRERILSEKEHLTVSHMKTLEEREKDLDIERETLRQSKSELDEMFQQIQKQLRHETSMRMDVERELELQMSMKQELEMSMKLLEKDVYEKQDGVETLREQLDNVKAINQDIYHKLQDKTHLEQQKTKTITKLEDETQQLATKVIKMQQQLSEAERQVDFAREHMDQLTHQLGESEKQRTSQSANLQIEREWREALQSQIENHEEEKQTLRSEVRKLESVRDELANVQRERDRLREANVEQEVTIQDLAGHLGQSKQEIGEIREVHKTVVGSTWEKDNKVSECVQCTKPFSISRRKHHCRKCGQIYCNACSDNVMTLASSAKPVRVCDNCHTTLLERFSAS